MYRTPDRLWEMMGYCCRRIADPARILESFWRETYGKIHDVWQRVSSEADEPPPRFSSDHSYCTATDYAESVATPGSAPIDRE